MNGRNSARKCLLALAVAGMLAASTAMADDTPAMEPAPSDDLAQTPMECLMPSLPEPGLNYGQTLPDALGSGMTSMSDFVQNSAVYLNCMRNKVEQNASIIYQRLMNVARAKLGNLTQKDK